MLDKPYSASIRSHHDSRSNARAHRSQGPRHRRLQGRAGDRDPGQARRHGQSRGFAGHARIRQGDRWMCRRPLPAWSRRSRSSSATSVSEGSPILTLESPTAQRGAGRTGCAERGRRDGAAAAAPAAPQRRVATAAAPAPAPTPAPPLRAPVPHSPATADVECDDARARRGPRRLQRRVSRRRSRHEDGAGRALCDARRRLPQRRLHPVEGAAAHRGGRSTKRARWPSTASPSARRRSISPKLRAWKDKVVGKLTGGLTGMAKARKVASCAASAAFSTRITSRSRRPTAKAGTRPAAAR